MLSFADRNSRKLAIVGDDACGKTSLLSRFTLGYSPLYCLPPTFESYVTEIRVDARPVQLALWDTADREDCEELRYLAYLESHVVLFAFSVDKPDSLETVKQKWIKEAREICPNVAIILVGLKKDLRENQLAIEDMNKKGLEFVSPGQGLEMAKQCGAKQYLECSSLTGEGVDDVFAAATRAALLTVDHERHRSGRCLIL